MSKQWFAARFREDFLRLEDGQEINDGKGIADFLNKNRFKPGEVIVIGDSWYRGVRITELLYYAEMEIK